jgi:membrane-associated HD superfamily phosphohydrolase
MSGSLDSSDSMRLISAHDTALLCNDLASMLNLRIPVREKLNLITREERMGTLLRRSLVSTLVRTLVNSEIVIVHVSIIFVMMERICDLLLCLIIYFILYLVICSLTHRWYSIELELKNTVLDSHP